MAPGLYLQHWFRNSAIHALIGYSLTRSESTKHYATALEHLKKGIERFSGAPFVPSYILGDGAASITQAVSQVWPELEENINSRRRGLERSVKMSQPLLLRIATLRQRVP